MPCILFELANYYYTPSITRSLIILFYLKVKIVQVKTRVFVLASYCMYYTPSVTRLLISFSLQELASWPTILQ